MGKPDDDDDGIAPDTLRSNDQMEVIIGLCEGEIDGFYSARTGYDGLDSVMLDDTPFRNLDSSLNFDDATVVLYRGTSDQAAITPELGGIARSRSVGVSLAYNIPVTRTSQGGTDVNYLDIRLVISALYDNDNYSNNSLTCTFLIEWKLSSATSGWKSHTVDVVGKTTSSSFVREVRIPVSPDATANNRYDIRVTLKTQSHDNFVANANWESFQEVQTKTYSWANTAILHFWCRASDQITARPEISGVYKCMRVKVPSNFEPTTRTYSGVWDGAFKVAWTDDPAWCLYDMVMNDRYGLSAYGDITLNKWDALRASKFCNRFVPAMELSDSGLPVYKASEALTSDATVFDYYAIVAVGPTSSGYWYTHPIRSDLISTLIQFSEDGSSVAYYSGTGKSIGYTVTFPSAGTYTVSLWADDAVAILIDGTQIAYTDDDTTDGNGGAGDFTFSGTAGTHVLKLTVINKGFSSDASANPYAVTAVLKDPSGNVIWTTRSSDMLITSPTCPSGYTYSGGHCTKANPDTYVWEPRFTFNGVIADVRSAMEQVRYMAGAFHGVLYDDLDGTLRLCVPDAQDPVAIFNQANVEDGLFEYSMTDLTTRYNDWTVSYTNPDIGWTEDRMRIYDSELIDTYGRLPTDFIAIACIYESEAIRRAYYRYQIATTQIKAVKFKTNRQGCWVRPYDRIRIADPHADGKQMGRVKSISADRKTVTLYDGVDVTRGNGFDYYAVVAFNYNGMYDASYPLNDVTVVMSKDGSTPDYFYGETKTVGYTITCSVDGAYTIRLWADDLVTAYLDGTQIGAGGLSTEPTDAAFAATAGTHVLTLAFYNSDLASSTWTTNPCGFAGRLFDPSGNEIWNTRTGTVITEAGSSFIIQTPGGSEVYAVASSGTDLTEIALQTALTTDLPEEHFPFNIIAEAPSAEKVWRVVAVTEVDGSPDKVQIEAVNDWGFDDAEPTQGDGGSSYAAGPTIAGVVSPTTTTVTTQTSPVQNCPTFSDVWTEDGLEIKITPSVIDTSYAYYNGEYKVYSRLQGSSDAWAQRATSANLILNHPAGAYEFKVLPYNIYGVCADLSSSPTCAYTVPACPPSSVLGSPEGVEVTVSWDGAGGRYAYMVDWTTSDAYAAAYQVVVQDSSGATTYRTATVQTNYFRYTAALQVADGVPSTTTSFLFKVSYIDKCGSVGSPTSITAYPEDSSDTATSTTYDSSTTINYNCAALANPRLQGYAENIVDMGSRSGETELDLGSGNVFTITLAGDVTISFSGGCDACGKAVTIIYTRSDDFQVTYDVDDVKWRNGSQPDLMAETTMHLFFYFGSAVGWLAGVGGASFG